MGYYPVVVPEVFQKNNTSLSQTVMNFKLQCGLILYVTFFQEIAWRQFLLIFVPV